MYRRMSCTVLTLVILILAAGPAAAQGVIMTVAGGGASLGDGGQATAAQLTSPRSVAHDASGNLYIADFTGHRVRKVTKATGVITTVAGTGVSGYSGDGAAATLAQVQNPAGLAVDAAGNLYIADRGNHRIRVVSASTGYISTVAGTGTGGFSGDGAAATLAQLNYPLGVAVDAAGNLYIADYSNHRIRKVTQSTGNISTIAGTGVRAYGGDGGLATAAQLDSPRRVALDPSGTYLFIADTGNNRVRTLPAAGGVIITVAGTGTAGYNGDGIAGTAADLNTPVGISVDALGSLYIADSDNHRVRMVDWKFHLISTVAGTGGAGFGGDGGPATSAAVNSPQGVDALSSTEFYVADTGNARIRRVTFGGLITGTVTNATHGTPLSGVTVQVYNSGGTFVTSANSDLAGVYTLTGISSGTCYLRTSNELGYLDEVYNNIPCVGGTCPAVTTGAAVTVVNGEATTGIDIGLVLNGYISGTVTDANTSAPLTGVSVLAYNASNTPLAAVTTNASGQYTITGLPNGTYYVKTANGAGYIDEVYNNIPCALGVCPNPSTGSGIGVASGGNTSGINIALTSGSTISGSVADASNGTPLASGFVYFYSAGGAFLGSASVTGGAYSRAQLQPGTYYLKTGNSLGYIDEVYNDLPCIGGTCPAVTAGTGVTIGTGTTTPGISFALARGASISGRVEAGGSGTLLAGVVAHIYSSAGTWVASATTDASGVYTKALLAVGTYHVRTSNTLGYIDELFNNIPCEGGACTVTSGTGIALTGGVPTNGIDFVLTPGGTISGTVTDAGTGLPVANVSVRAYNTGNFYVAGATTNASGAYTLTGLATGTHYVATLNSLGYVDELYNDIPCPGSQCPLFNTGTAVPVTAGSPSGPINFTLAAGGAITGTVSVAGSGATLNGVSVYVLTEDGSYLARATTNASGVYTKAGLPPGTYHVATLNTLGYVDELYNNVSCPGTFSCDQASGAPVIVAAGQTTGVIDFGLEAGGTISGTVTAGGSPAQWITVQVYDGSGKIVGSDQTDAAGVYVTPAVPAGTYYVRTANPFGYINEVYDNLPCAGGTCPDVTSGAGVAVTVGNSTGGIGFDLVGFGGGGDFSGDSRSDILWRHVSQGDLWLWPMDGVARTAEVYVRTIADTNWEIRAIADFTGDRAADLLWRNKVDGQVYFWPMDGATPLAELYVGTVDPAYDIVGTGDFDGDGKSDLLWRHTTLGDVWIWLMDGATPKPGGQVYIDRVDPGYVVKGVGDLDADTKADIVWHHATTGEVWVWPMNGTTRLDQVWVGSVPDTGYQIQSVADFTGDGKADLLWWHTTLGEVWIWTMNGSLRAAETWVATVPDTSYRIAGTGDYNGDGRADVLWHHSTRGEVWIWLMDGTTKLSETWVATVPDTGYRIIK